MTKYTKARWQSDIDGCFDCGGQLCWKLKVQEENPRFPQLWWNETGWRIEIYANDDDDGLNFTISFTPFDDYFSRVWFEFETLWEAMFFGLLCWHAQGIDLPVYRS